MLIYCHAGCQTSAVLGAVGLTFSDLYADARTPIRPVRLDSGRQRLIEAECALLKWRELKGRETRDRLLQGHRLIAKGEQLLKGDQESDRGWDLMGLGYLGLSRLEWVLDLLDSREATDWIQAQEFLGEHHDH